MTARTTAAFRALSGLPTQRQNGSPDDLAGHFRAGTTVSEWRLLGLGRTEAERIDQGHAARLLEGPRDGARVWVASRPGGGPAEVLSVDEDGRGLYLLAGYPDLSGTRPYRWITRHELAGLRRWLRLGRPAQRTSRTPHQGRPRG